MKTEWEKCLAGEWYDCHDKVFLELKEKTNALLLKYNSLPYGKRTERYEVLKEMFGGIGKKVAIATPFTCDYGCNIFIGENVSINACCTFIDCNRITIGNNVLIAPDVKIYTATHPVELAERLYPTKLPDGSIRYQRRTYALPVTIEDGCWIGGGTVILLGITIGKGTVIGAGSVVCRNIPEDCVAVGNPCRVIRKINQSRND